VIGLDLKSVQVIEYTDQYAEKISEIITRNLLEVNIKDYSEEEMHNLALNFTVEEIMDYAKYRKIYIAIIDNQPIGTLSVVKSWDGEEGDYHFLTIFVLPEYHQKGVGRLLMEEGEKYVHQMNGKKISIPSSITSHKFYNKLGYQYKDNIQEPDSAGHIMLIKLLDEDNNI
jgi:GNAT superfamily N-acetyltransferase